MTKEIIKEKFIFPEHNGLYEMRLIKYIDKTEYTVVTKSKSGVFTDKMISDFEKELSYMQDSNSPITELEFRYNCDYFDSVYMDKVYE